MSSRQEHGPVTITLSSDERGVVLERVDEWTREGRDPHKFDTREEATATLTDLNRAFVLCDELKGWPDVKGEAFVATVTPELIELLRGLANELRESLEYDREAREKMARDEPGMRWPHETVEQLVAKQDAFISAEEDELRICEELLARLDAVATVPA